jgi:Xaa-Pro dipeptidase
LSYYVHREKALIYVLHPYQIPKEGIPQNFTFSDGTHSSLYASPWDTSRLQPAMDAARVIKSPYELKMIRKANAISAKAHENVLRSIRNLTNETEVEAIFTATCIAQHAKRQAYGIIAGSGENASTLHYVANNEPLKGRQLMCLDAGCEWELYASDVTRTFPISGTFTPEAKEIYDIVAQMQDECIKMCKPGVNFRAIHMHAHLIATTGLIKLGVLHNGTPMEIYRSGASVAFFPHGVSSAIPLSYGPLIHFPAGPLLRSRGARCRRRRQPPLPHRGEILAGEVQPSPPRHRLQPLVSARRKLGHYRRARNVSPCQEYQPQHPSTSPANS